MRNVLQKSLAKELKIITMMADDLEALGVAPVYDFQVKEISDLYDIIHLAAIRCKERIGLLEAMGYTDALTQIPNRLSFDKRFDLEYFRAQREQSTLSLLMIDIDDFKDFNDNFGHQIGDTLLRGVAQTIVNSLSRKTDFAARYGGEEFAVILPNTTENGAMLLAEFIRKNVESSAYLPNQIHKITVSIGATTVGMTAYGAFDNQESLITRAGKALLAAKKDTKNCVKYLTFDENEISA